MATFVRIEPAEEQPTSRDRGSGDRGSGSRDRDGGARTINVSLDVGRTLALLLLGLLVLGAALALYLADKDSAASGFFVLGQAIIVGGFGVAIGEGRGANEAVRQLSG
jgi:hypothetical protein